MIYKTTLIYLLLIFTNISYSQDINWLEFDKTSFDKARAENKFVILDLVAVWCHWCHVMEKTTYHDKKVNALLNKYFITTKADHDLRPDLAERYRDWGWPATIILTSDGTEIVKRAGYISPINMAKLLQAIVDDPSPETSTLQLPKELSKSGEISPQIIKVLEKMHIQAYDEKQGGLKLNQKFLDLESLQWDLFLATKGDKKAVLRANKTLKSAAKLIDPEFGGAYQYSTDADWDHAHYEKIMHTQYKYLTAYSQACQVLKNNDYCENAKNVARFLIDFLYSKQKNAFYTSQDADLKQGTKAHDYFKLEKKKRLALGLPRIDKHIYSSHNGKAIEGVVNLYLATNDKNFLIPAIKATQWIIDNRTLTNGGYKHGKRDTAGPYLADTLYMGRAFLSIYEATKIDKYLNLALKTVAFIDNNFKNSKGGLLSAVGNGTPAKPLPQLDQNIDAARFLIQLNKIKPSAEIKSLLNHTMKLLATKIIVTSRFTEAGVLLVNAELNK